MSLCAPPALQSHPTASDVHDASIIGEGRVSLFKIPQRTAAPGTTLPTCCLTSRGPRAPISLSLSSLALLLGRSSLSRWDGEGKGCGQGQSQPSLSPPGLMQPWSCLCTDGKLRHRAGEHIARGIAHPQPLRLPPACWVQTARLAE